MPAGNAVLQEAVERVLIAGKVDLVIQAHVHQYERSLPLMYGQPTQNYTTQEYVSPTAPVYIVNGAAGNRESNQGGVEPPKPWEPKADPANGIRPYSGDISYGLMSMSKGSLKWEQRWSKNNSVLDTFHITK
jgi:hypothetical protein